MQTACRVLKACPLCLSGLEHAGGLWVCSKCGKVGADYGSVPCFNDPDYYWGEISREAMQRFNETARDKGWRQAVDIELKGAVREYVTDPHRADFQHVWDLPRGSSILDIGAGLGAIASGLGANFASVVAVEGVLERARFIETRVRQMGLDSVQVICADFARLPLAPNQFDVVVLNGVLEWIGLATSDDDPRESQLKFLKRVHSLLKPSGFVCVGIENRIGWAMLRGAGDHSGLPYTSLMPRRMAAAWCNWKGRGYRSDHNRGYRAYTYSLPGYRKLLREAGFPSLTPFHTWYGYNKPTVLLPLDHKAALLKFVERLGLRGSLKGRVRDAILRAAIRCGVWAHLASEYVFLARKS